MPSESPNASSDPRGENATLQIIALCVNTLGAAAASATLHNCKVPSSPAPARVFPSGEKATSRIRPSCPLRVPISCRSATLHSRTIPSSPADAMTVPSGEKATARTVAACRVSSPEPTLQMRTVLSYPLDATVEPSGEIATATIRPEMAGQYRCGLKAWQSPGLDRSVVPRRDQQIAGIRDRQIADWPIVTLHNPNGSSRRAVKHHHRAVVQRRKMCSPCCGTATLKTSVEPCMMTAGADSNSVGASDGGSSARPAAAVRATTYSMVKIAIKLRPVFVTGPVLPRFYSVVRLSQFG